jgi:hypothetical protein
LLAWNSGLQAGGTNATRKRGLVAGEMDGKFLFMMRRIWASAAHLPDKLKV